MKNIHVVPTDKPSRFFKDDLGYYFSFETLQRSNFINQNIYITSDEEIKEGDWYLIEFNGLKITQCTSTEELISIEGRNDCKKIILTTDQDLIKDGVQAIDDEFLEWFVKNPSCEYVEVKKGFADGTAWGYNFLDYKIIIPKEEPKQELPIINGSYGCTIQTKKEEPKQETLEKAAERYADEQEKKEENNYNDCYANDYNGFLDGAKYQSERMYSEEDMLNFSWFLIENIGQFSCDRTAHFEGKYLEQFKKK
jgi:hypothetical protein